MLRFLGMIRIVSSEYNEQWSNCVRRHGTSWSVMKPMATHRVVTYWWVLMHGWVSKLFVSLYMNLKHTSLWPIINLLEALDDFNDSGKPIYAFSNHYNQHAYLLASAADSIFLDPNGSLEIKGYSYTSPFYKKLMEKLGVEYKIYYAGDYKGATEPFRRTDLSEKNAYQWKVHQ